jgi:hypothetical protein
MLYCCIETTSEIKAANESLAWSSRGLQEGNACIHCLQVWRCEAGIVVADHHPDLSEWELSPVQLIDEW